jgi:hypothetical protein
VSDITPDDLHIALLVFRLNECDGLYCASSNDIEWEAIKVIQVADLPLPSGNLLQKFSECHAFIS